MPQDINMSISIGPMRLALALEQGMWRGRLYQITNAHTSPHGYSLLLLFFSLSL